MYEARQNKEKVSRRIDEKKQKRKLDISTLQRVEYVTTYGKGFLKLKKGKVTIKNAQDIISLSGYLYGSQSEDSYLRDGTNKIDVMGHLKYKYRDNKFIIETISSTPKRTGCGAILMYHLALIAENTKDALICTELSALEEGTPEFYRKMNLFPDKKWADDMDRIVQDEIDAGLLATNNVEKRRFYLYYSGALQGYPSFVKEAAFNSFNKYWVKSI